KFSDKLHDRFVHLRRLVAHIVAPLSPRRHMLVKQCCHHKRQSIRWPPCKSIQASRLDFGWQLIKMSVNRAQCCLQFRATHERLVGPQEQRDNSLVQSVGRSEHHAEGQVEQVHDVNEVGSLSRRSHFRNKISGYSQAVEEHDRIEVIKIRGEFFDRRPPCRHPPLRNLSERIVAYGKQ